MAFRVARHLALTSRARRFSASNVSVEPARSAKSEISDGLRVNRRRSSPGTESGRYSARQHLACARSGSLQLHRTRQDGLFA